MTTRFPSRTVVLSPHLDDGVLSLGSAISRATRDGAHVRVMTVFAGDVASARPVSGWDSLVGFATEGEAVRDRRAEDAEACGHVGAEPMWLPFSDAGYVGERDEETVALAISEAVRGFDAVLVPGFPLIHRDHGWVSRCALRAGLPCATIGLYAEQPYRYRVKRQALAVEASIRSLLEAEPTWCGLGTRFRDIRAKRRAIKAYRSQLPGLSLDGAGGAKLARMLLHEALRGGEAIAWVTPRSSRD